jgi:hypothetical protein
VLPHAIDGAQSITVFSFAPNCSIPYESPIRRLLNRLQTQRCVSNVFMLITVQPFFFASSKSALLNVLTSASGGLCAGPYILAVRVVVQHQHSSRTPSSAVVYSSICRSPMELPNAALGRRPIIK